MVNRLSLKTFLAAVLFCLFLQVTLHAQNDNQVNYRIDIRYIQRLTWAGDEYAMRYEVVIERQEGRRFNSFLREFTEEELIEVSLPPGNYRYQVIPYDFLNSPIPVTEWTEFEVLRAPAAGAGTRESVPSETVQFIFPQASDKFDFFLGASWEPILPVYNADLFPGENMSFAGAALKFAFVFGNQNYLNPGVELGVSWKMTDEAHLITASLNFIAQVRLPPLRTETSSRAALNFRAGFGISLLTDSRFEELPEIGTFHFNLGISFLFLVTRNLYFEIGADCPQFVSDNHHGYLYPWIGIGVRF